MDLQHQDLVEDCIELIHKLSNVWIRFSVTAKCYPFAGPCIHGVLFSLMFYSMC